MKRGGNAAVGDGVGFWVCLAGYVENFPGTERRRGVGMTDATARYRGSLPLDSLRCLSAKSNRQALFHTHNHKRLMIVNSDLCSALAFVRVCTHHRLYSCACLLNSRAKVVRLIHREEYPEMHCLG